MHLARAQKKARREGRLILFVDESGISQRPTRVRTWAPKGDSPVVQFHFNWDHVSIIAGMHCSGVTFRLHDGAIRKEEVVELLKALNAHYRRKLLIVWDGAKPHRSRLVHDYVKSTGGQIVVERLPAYAPELNPVEYLWAWLKRHALANYCPNTQAELHHGARAKLKSAQRRSSIITACWSQAELF
jgi:transposase